jgi:nitroreductase
VSAPEIPTPIDIATIGEDVPLLEGIRTTRAIRRLRPDPVPRELIRKVCEAGTFAPSGGNRQPWHVAVVKDRALRQQLADLCWPVWQEYMEIGATGATPFAVAGPQPEPEPLDPVPNPVLSGLVDAPVVLVLAADLRSIAMMDGNLDRPTITGGASVYPFAHTLLLAARDRGLGGVLTTFLARAEPAARPLLGLPDDWAIAALLVLGHPVARPTRLRRKPVSEFATVDRFDGPAFGV